MEFQKPIYKWYAVYTKVNQEKKIFKWLKEDRIECYLPLRKVLRYWSNRKVWIEEPFFRCYLFVYVSHIEFFRVMSIPGVVRYVMFGGQAASIPDQQVDHVKRLVDQQEREIYISAVNLKKGQHAEVLFGPFKGMKGEVLRVCNNYRIIIRINTLGCNLSANISRDEIKVLKSLQPVSAGKSRQKLQNCYSG